jgi:hypothetical protein
LEETFINYQMTVTQDPNDKDIQWVELELYNPYKDIDSSNKTLH